MTSSWQWWPMIVLWPSAAPCTTRSSCTPGSVHCWVLVSWMTSAMNSLLQSLMVLQLTFCTEVEIPRFFCELNQMVQLACSDTFLNGVVMCLASVLLAGGPFAGILYSYSKIVSSIRRISSTQGKFKAFSTCASHLSVVLLFYCTSLGVYLSSAATHSSHSSATASVMYSVFTPKLNPFLYSLRNEDIKRALWDSRYKKGTVLGQMKCPWLHCSKPEDQWLWHSSQCREKFAPSTYFLGYPFL